MPSKELQVKDLKFDKKNARLHTEKGIRMLKDGITEVGLARSIVIDENNVILCGNGAAEAAAAAGVTKLRIVETAGDELVAVRRSGLSNHDKTKLALLDNRTQEKSSWNTDVLKDIASSDIDALKGLWDSEELDFLLAKSNTDEVLSAVSNEMKAEESSVERVVLWIERESHAGFLTSIRVLGERYGVDDVGQIICLALNGQLEK